MLTRREFLKSLQAIEKRLTEVWPDGREEHCVQGDGRHFSLPGTSRPVSLSLVERYFLFNFCYKMRCKRVLEIGTGFGLSTVWMARSLQEIDADAMIVTVDNLSEGQLGSRGQKFLKTIAKELDVSRNVRSVVGDAADLCSKESAESFDMIFVDGNHNFNNPIRDYFAGARIVKPKGSIVFHDVQSKYTVGEAIVSGIRDGWSPVVYPTSCRLGVLYRDMIAFDCAQDAYQNAKVLQLC